MSAYQTIDLALAEWADKNSLHWYSEYQDTEVIPDCAVGDSRAGIPNLLKV